MNTLDYYDEHAEEYSEATFGTDMSDEREQFLSCLPYGAEVLDLGCGSGRDSAAFLKAGCKVTAVDGSERMCQIAERNIGVPVRRLTFDRLDYEACFDGVWACSSLLHVPSAELPSVLGLVSRSLRDGGVLYCCFKKGEFEGERDGRHYTDMTVASLTDLVSESGYLPVRVWESTEPGRNIIWVNALVRKFSF